MEINHTDLLRALMRRADRDHRELLEAMRRNDRLNARFQSINDELDRLCNVVSSNRKENGIGQTLQSASNDLRDVDNEQSGQTDTARWENCKSDECSYRKNYFGCLVRQRAGNCTTTTRRRD